MTERAKASKPTARATTARERAAQVVATFSPYLIRRHRAQLCTWAEANGLDPDAIPDTHPIRVEEGESGTVIRYRAFVLTDSGHTQPDPSDTTEVLTEECTAPCTVPPPDLGATARPDPYAEGDK
ncbi:hypothetical protein [Streptomyces formicae]|uniref:Uncharacterized protein n=1 Tax=Streptomyces formicae TaxID=1616117 RepID=A0ABY3WQN8_9ACTN|nr:hypothetical protein [Streptomyces formicae]UNM13779.1 hypothetical protein J4032_22040 [Streptomyces formicae]